jgi:hypothetical protein
MINDVTHPTFPYWDDPYVPIVLSGEDDRRLWLSTEYAANFMSEGQSFFAFKRMNFDRMPFASLEYSLNTLVNGPVAMTEKEWIFPNPETIAE